MTIRVSRLIGVETFVFNKQAPSCVVNISFVILMRAEEKINSVYRSSLLQLMFISFYPWPRVALAMKTFGNAAVRCCCVWRATIVKSTETFLKIGNVGVYFLATGVSLLIGVLNFSWRWKHPYIKIRCIRGTLILDPNSSHLWKSVLLFLLRRHLLCSLTVKLCVWDCYGHETKKQQNGWTYNPNGPYNLARK